MASTIERLAHENEALRAELDALRAASGLPPRSSPFSSAAQGVAAAAEARAAAAVTQAQAHAQAAVAQAQATAAAASAAAAAAVAAAIDGATRAGRSAPASGPADAAPSGPAALYAPAPPAPIDVEAEEPGQQQQRQQQGSTTSSSSSSDEEDAALLEEALARGVNWPPPSTGAAWRAAGGSSVPPADAFFWSAPPRATPMPLDVSATAGGPPVPPQDPRALHVVHLSAELAPFAKVGGLADVVTGLARACSARGHRVQVCLPFYEFLESAAEEGGAVVGLRHEGDVDVPKGQVRDGRVTIGALATSVYSATIAGVNVLLVKPAERARSPLFRGARIYGGGYNETEAYLFFCRACLEWLARSGAQPDILHFHDWQQAAGCMLFWELYHVSAGGPFQRASVVYTIHNLDSTGEVRADEFAAFLGLEAATGARFGHVDRALDERTIGHSPERLSLMKGGLVYAAAVTTVSPTYAREIMTGGASGWLRPTFARADVSRKVRGILNGIDYDEWDPANDAFLPANYSAQFPAGKACCKAFVQRGLGLDVDPAAPLVVAVTRLVPQKGIPLLVAAARRAIELGGQVVILGTGHADGDLRRLADGELLGSGRGRVVLLHSEALAHQLYGAADVVLVPSYFEPCGLTQMIAARYGAVPLVRRTGGLADTVADVDDTPPGWPIAGGGYVFDAPTEDAVRGALDRCLARYRERPEAWAELRAANMVANFSWSASAKIYVDVYYGLSGGAVA